MRLTLAALAALTIATTSHAGGLAPESLRPAPEVATFTLCPPHTPWTMCQGEKDGPEPNSTPRPPRVPPQYPPVVKLTPVKEPPPQQPCHVKRC